MNTNFIFATLLFLSYSISSFASDPIDAILGDADATWAAEVYTDYAPNMSQYSTSREKMMAKYGLSQNHFTTLKIQHSLANDPIRLIGITLANQMLKMESNSTTKLFKDAALKETLSYADYQNIIKGKTTDTIFITQADGTTEVGQVFRRKMPFGEVPLFRVKQILHYNKKTNELSLTPIAVAPLFCAYNKEGELTGTSPLFWMPIQDINKAIDLNAPSINWAKRMTRSIDADDVTVIKGKESFPEILRAVLDGFAAKPNTSKIHHTYGDMPLMTPKDIATINSGIDTIITFDPVTFEEIVSEVTNTITPETMRKMSIIQDWAWNKETQSISIQLVAFAPIVKIYDNKKNFIGSSAIFYKRSNE